MIESLPPFSFLSLSAYAILFLTGSASASFVQQVVADGSGGASYFDYLQSGAVARFEEGAHPAAPSSPTLSAFIPRGSVPTPKPTGCFIKAMITESGEKTYLVPGCPGFEEATVDLAKKEKTFCSEHLAVKAGWTKAKACPR